MSMNNETLPILIVDDDSFQRRMIRIKLQTHGYEVNEAEDGVEALEFLSQQNYSLVLLDIVMPQLNGWEVLDQIRANQSAAELPVIMMTARDNGYDQNAAQERGATDYLTKPIDFSALDDRIDALLQVNEAETAAAAPAASEQPAEEEPAAEADDADARAAGRQADGAREAPARTPFSSQATSRNTPDSLLDGVLKNIPGVVFRAIGDGQGTVQLSYESDGLQDFMGQRWSSVQQIIASADNTSRREINRQFRDHTDRLERVFVQFPLQTPRGRRGWAECRATPHRLPSGETVWDALLLDISQHKQAELERDRQHVGDAARMTPLLELYRRLHTALAAGESTTELQQRIRALEAQDTAQESSVAPPAADDSAAAYRDEQGFVHQCSQCRRVQNFSTDGEWELIPAWTRQMPLQTTHTVCSTCAESDALA